MIEHHKISERSACQLVRQSRSANAKGGGVLSHIDLFKIEALSLTVLDVRKSFTRPPIYHSAVCLIRVLSAFKLMQVDSNG